MRATGIVRRIDELGRVVIPKEIRRTLHLLEGTPMEIFTDREGAIVLKKYSPMAEIGTFARQYCEALGQVFSCLIVIADRDQIVAAAGPERKKFLGQGISNDLEERIVNRDMAKLPEGSEKAVPLCEGDVSAYVGQMICPIISQGDAIVAVVLASQSAGAPIGEAEQKAAICAANFLGRQMEA